MFKFKAKLTKLIDIHSGLSGLIAENTKVTVNEIESKSLMVCGLVHLTNTAAKR
jgi:hypothetical protein